MSLCLIVGLAAITLEGPDFTLSWRHSVEQTEWREEWRLEPGGLRLTGAAVKGSGAGMEPGEGARLQGGWWVWTPDAPAVAELWLAASGATGAGWTLCSGAVCHELGARPDDALRLAPCKG